MSPSTFEDRLLAELREVVATRPAPSRSPARSPRRRPVLVAAGAVAAAAVAAVVVLASGGGASPAYAVERQPDGDVTVTVKSLSDADGLEAKLRAEGISADVTYTPLGKMCKEPRGRSAASGRQSMGVRIREDGSASFTIPRGDVKAGQTLVISAAGGGGGVTTIGTSIVEGPVAPCQLVDAPAAPPAGAITHSTGGPEKGLSSGRDSGDGPSTQVAP